MYLLRLAVKFRNVKAGKLPHELRTFYFSLNFYFCSQGELRKTYKRFALQSVDGNFTLLASVGSEKMILRI